MKVPRQRGAPENRDAEARGATQAADTAHDTAQRLDERTARAILARRQEHRPCACPGTLVAAADVHPSWPALRVRVDHAAGCRPSQPVAP